MFDDAWIYEWDRKAAPPGTHLSIASQTPLKICLHGRTNQIPRIVERIFTKFYTTEK
jgi:hypothetical protein